jgi:cytochrome P450
MLVIRVSETFPKVFANGNLRLWEHSEKRARLVADSSGIDDAFNEILRYDMPTQFLGRMSSVICSSTGRPCARTSR